MKMTPHYTQSNQHYQFKRKSKSHSFDIFQFSFLIISKSPSQSQNNMRKAIEIISPQQDSSTGEAEIRMQAPRLRPRTASDTGHECVCMYVCMCRCMYMFSHLLRISVHLCCIFVLLLKSFVGALPIVVMNADASRLRPCISITKSWQEVMAVLTGMNADASRLRPCISSTKSWQKVMAVLTGYALNNPTWGAKSRLWPRETSDTAIEHVCFLS